MRLAAGLGLALLLAGCALPPQNEPFCYPKAKYSRETKAAFLGLRCGW